MLRSSTGGTNTQRRQRRGSAGNERSCGGRRSCSPRDLPRNASVVSPGCSPRVDPPARPLRRLKASKRGRERTVVVHPQNAPSALPTMMGSRRLVYCARTSLPSTARTPTLVTKRIRRNAAHLDKSCRTSVRPCAYSPRPVPPRPAASQVPAGMKTISRRRGGQEEDHTHPPLRHRAGISPRRQAVVEEDKRKERVEGCQYPP